MRAAPTGVSALVRSVNRTTRWHWEGRDALERLWAEERPVIYAFWHGRMLMMLPFIVECRPRPLVLISNNRDGEMIARAVGRFGTGTIRGSTRNPGKQRAAKGGTEAMRAALDHLSRGGSMAITPDGPRGPLMRAQFGVAVLSRQAQVPVVPAAWSKARARMLGSWDRFLLPLPFGRGFIVAGEPVSPPSADSDEKLEVHRQRIEEAVTAATRRADALAKRETPEPGTALGA